MIVLPPGWVAAHAPVATLLARCGPSVAWWLAGALLLAGGFVLALRKPNWSLALAVAAMLAIGVSQDGLVDDAYIQFRYAANLAAGNGPVFNPGERIEGASGGAWIAVLAAGPVLLGINPGVWGRLLSLVVAAISVFVAGRAVRSVAGEPAGALAALIWAAIPTTGVYAATGLETAAYGLTLWLVAWTVLAGSPRLPWFSGIAAAVLRPETAVIAASELPWFRRLDRSARTLLLAAVLAAVSMVALRLAYYGAPVPRPVTVKAFTAAAGVGFGLAYLAGAIAEWWPLLGAVPLLVRHRRALIPAFAPAALWTALVVVRGGDWMPGSRYLLPLLVLLTAAVAASTEGLARLSATAMAVWGCLLLAPVPNPRVPVVGSAWRAMAEHRVQSRWWEALGALLGDSLPPDTTLASGPSGALPFASRLRTFDMFGLCSLVTDEKAGFPGHRLWGLRQASGHADVIYPGTSLPQRPEVSPLLAAAEAGVAAVPHFRDLYKPIVVLHEPEAPLDIGADVLWVTPPVASWLSHRGAVPAGRASR